MIPTGDWREDTHSLPAVIAREKTSFETLPDYPQVLPPSATPRHEGPRDSDPLSLPQEQLRARRMGVEGELFAPLERQPRRGFRNGGGSSVRE